eukprot:GHVN01017401.1.p1 GENE.GHVN01017401.1~~GHVN01017401.1.p1  ORF type:complete len:101 (-),score=2.38 GHVN01017401.1:105-407(-)
MLPYLPRVHQSSPVPLFALRGAHDRHMTQGCSWHLPVVETKKLLGICTSKIASFVIHMLQNQGWVLCSAIAIPAFFFFSHDFIWGKYVVVDTIIHFRVSG